jgi:competence protein ComEC
MLTGWFCPPLAWLLGIFANSCYAFLTGMIAWFHALPWSYFWVPGFSAGWLAVLYAPYLFASVFPQLRPKKRWLVVAAARWLLIAFAVHSVKQWDDWRNDRLYVRVLSVGHGLCVHIKTPDGRSVLYDVGSLSSPFKSTNIAANSLWSFGRRKIDAVIISHPDSDHFNGLPMLLEKFPADAVYVTPFMFQKEGRAIDAVHDALTSRNIPVITLTAGDIIDRPGFPTMSVLHPSAPDVSQLSLSTDSNVGSLVLMIEHRGHRVLLPGDLESKLKPEFMQEPPMRVDVILSPHHGSVKPTADELVAWATPDYVIISGGLFTYNPNSKPHFEKSGSRVFETLKNGMVETIIDRHGIRMRPWR